MDEKEILLEQDKLLNTLGKRKKKHFEISFYLLFRSKINCAKYGYG